MPVRNNSFDSREERRSNSPSWMNTGEDFYDWASSLPMKGLGLLTPKPVKDKLGALARYGADKIGPENTKKGLAALDTGSQMADLVHPIAAPLNIPKATLATMRKGLMDSLVKNEGGIDSRTMDPIKKLVDKYRTSSYLGGADSIQPISPMNHQSLDNLMKKMNTGDQLVGLNMALGPASASSRTVADKQGLDDFIDFLKAGGNENLPDGQKRTGIIVNEPNLDTFAQTHVALKSPREKVLRHELTHTAQGIKGMSSAVKDKGQSQYGIDDYNTAVGKGYGHYQAQPEEIAARTQERGITAKVAKEFMESSGIPSSGNRLMDRWMVEVMLNPDLDHEAARKSMDFLDAYLRAHRDRSSYMKNMGRRGQAATATDARDFVPNINRFIR